MSDTNAKLRGWMAENRVTGPKFAEMIEMPYDTFKVKMIGKTEWKLSEILKIMDVTELRFDQIF